MSVETLVLALDAISRRHLVRALEDHLRWCRANGLPFPDNLAQFALLVDRGGQERPDLTPASELVDAAPVVVALTYDEAGRVLSVSARTIRRMVEEGRLKAITVAGERSRRIHREDLVAYADSLRRHQGRGDGVNAAGEVGEGGEGRGSAPKTHLRRPPAEAEAS